MEITVTVYIGSFKYEASKFLYQEQKQIPPGGNYPNPFDSLPYPYPR